MGKYQPFNDLPAGQFELLKRDIEARGVILPILVDETGKTIDGHQRRRAAAELGIECPRVEVVGLTEEEKIGLSFTLNLFRRHLSGTERAKAIAALASRGLSTRRMSDLLGLSKSVIHRDIQIAEAEGEITRPDTIIGKDGREQPSHKPERQVSQSGTVVPPPGVDPQTGEIIEEEGTPSATGSGAGEDVAPGQTREASSPSSSSAPPETLEQRNKREAEEARVDRNVYFGKHLIGLSQILGDGDKPIDNLIAGWIPEECPAWLVEATRPTFTPDGMRDLAAVIEKLAVKWEAAGV